MKKEKFIVTDPIGFHARPATVAVATASKQSCNVSISYKGREVNMKSLMGVMSLGMPFHAEFEVVCEGKTEDEAMEAIRAALLSQRLIDA